MIEQKLHFPVTPKRNKDTMLANMASSEVIALCFWLQCQYGRAQIMILVLEMHVEIDAACFYFGCVRLVRAVSTL